MKIMWLFKISIIRKNMGKGNFFHTENYVKKGRMSFDINCEYLHKERACPVLPDLNSLQNSAIKAAQG